jgi:release factor glutamine methyltransferase
VRVVASVAWRLLRPGGLVLCEHDDTHAVSAPAVFETAGFTAVADHEDLTHRPRFLTATRP